MEEAETGAAADASAPCSGGRGGGQTGHGAAASLLFSALEFMV